MRSYIDSIPAKVRKAIYRSLATVFGVEWALELADWGLIPDEIQTKVLLVLAALGFTLSQYKTTDITVVREGS